MSVGPWVRTGLGGICLFVGRIMRFVLNSRREM